MAIEKIAVLRATLPLVGGGGGADSSPKASALAVKAAIVRRSAARPGGLVARRHGTMANIHSQKKRILRSERERLENRRYTSAIKTHFRTLTEAVEGGEGDAGETHRELVSTIDQAVKRGALHRNTGARKKSRAAKILSSSKS